jgi:hypothetical protein
MREQIEIYSAVEVLNPMLGLKTWGVHRGFSTYLVLEFGKEKEYTINNKKRLVGEYQVWIRDCAWHLMNNTEQIIACNDDNKDIDKSISFLEGCKLLSVSIQPNTLNTQFIFGKSVILSLFTCYFLKERISWQVILPNNKVLAFGSKGKISYEDIKKQGD